MAVLAESGDEMRLNAIHAKTEKLLDSAVSLHSVADYLRRRSTGGRPLFVRGRPGYYKLLGAKRFQ